MDPDFTQMKVPDLKKYLQARGISVSNKRKEELLELCCKAHELGIEVQDDEETSESNIAQKLMTADGQLPQPYSLKSDWTTDFSSLPNYTWGDMYAYLIVKEGYDHESLKAYKSLEGFRLHWDGHVQILQTNKSKYHEHSLLKFSVKPTERERTHLDNKPTYQGWFVLKPDGSILSAYCPCIGGADGACRHVGAALINLEKTLREETVVTCPGRRCTWKSRKRAHTEVTCVEEMDFTKPAVGKKKKTRTKPKQSDYDPRPSYLVERDLTKEFRKLLLECAPKAVGLHVMPDGDDCTVENVDEQANDCHDSGNSLTGTAIHGHDPFIVDNLAPMPEGAGLAAIREACIAVKRKLNFTNNEINIVEKKKKLQSQCAEWFQYKKGRISASKCKRIASLKPTTSPTKALKEVMGYKRIPQTAAMREGLEKEEEIAQCFLSEMESQGNVGVTVEDCGFLVSKTHGFPGATPNKIIHDPSEDNPGVLEMKYIQVKPGLTLREVLVKQLICCGNKEKLKMNKNHKYFFQMCHQMFVTQFKWGIFFAYGSNNELFMEKVALTEEFWAPVLKKLTHFFETVVATRNCLSKDKI